MDGHLYPGFFAEYTGQVKGLYYPLLLDSRKSIIFWQFRRLRPVLFWLEQRVGEDEFGAVEE
jgi:hypothetical protein